MDQVQEKPHSIKIKSEPTKIIQFDIGTCNIYLFGVKSKNTLENDQNNKMKIKLNKLSICASIYAPNCNELLKVNLRLANLQVFDKIKNSNIKLIIHKNMELIKQKNLSDQAFLTLELAMFAQREVELHVSLCPLTLFLNSFHHALVRSLFPATSRESLNIIP